MHLGNKNYSKKDYIIYYYVIINWAISYKYTKKKKN